MVDMSMDNEEKQEWAESAPVPSKYPYGLSISLTEKELDKLGIEASDIEVGDMLHLHALAKVTSVSCHDNEHGSTCRVELQICYLSGEDEEEENEEAESVTSRLYRK
jgi:hypothetical protein